MTEEEYESYPEWIKLRAVRVDVRRRGFRTRQYVLVTTLLDPAAYPAKDLAELYRRRWRADMRHPHYPSSDDLYHGRGAA
jgi:hypothetical protein